jgi:hypothetical protein
MSDQDRQPDQHGVDVSFAAVAGEDPRDGLAHPVDDEVDGGRGDVPDLAGAESTDGPPEEPTLSSMLGVGPVAEGDDPVI